MITTYTGQEGSLDQIDWEYWAKVLTTVGLVATGLGAVWRTIKGWAAKAGKAIKDVGDEYVTSVTAPQIAATKMLADGFAALNANVRDLGSKVEDLGGRASAIEDSQTAMMVSQARTETQIRELQGAVADIRSRLNHEVERRLNHDPEHS